jgi:hypothetical protein
MTTGGPPPLRLASRLQERLERRQQERPTGDRTGIGGGLARKVIVHYEYSMFPLFMIDSFAWF